MKALLIAIAMNLGLLIAANASAQAPASAPAGSTALCKDGSYSSGTNKRSACRGHKGTKEWFGATAATTGAAAAPATSHKSSRKSKTETASAMAVAPAAAPAGSTALCRDGTYSSGANKRSACRGHKGTKEWFGPRAAAATGTEAAPETTHTPARASKNEAATASATAPTAAPAGSTALCKDGSYSSGANKRSACRGHKGTKEWFGAAVAAATTATAPSSMAPTAAPGRSMASTPSNQPARTTAAPGGGAGQVWVNSESKVYHCQSDRYYGKTKKGEYMSEADARAKGNRAARGKSCSQ